MCTGVDLFNQTFQSGTSANKIRYIYYSRKVWLRKWTGRKLNFYYLTLRTRVLLFCLLDNEKSEGLKLFLRAAFARWIWKKKSNTVLYGSLLFLPLYYLRISSKLKSCICTGPWTLIPVFHEYLVWTHYMATIEQHSLIASRPTLCCFCRSTTIMMCNIIYLLNSVYTQRYLTLYIF